MSASSCLKCVFLKACTGRYENYYIRDNDDEETEIRSSKNIGGEVLSWLAVMTIFVCATEWLALHHILYICVPHYSVLK